MSGYICVFDCETIPDSDSLRVAYGYDGDDESVAKTALKAQKEQSGSEFLPVCFHKVVTISAVIADEFGRFKRVSTIAGSSEKEKISEFIKVLQDNNSDILGITRNYYKKTRTKDKDYWLKLDIKSNIKFNINKKGLIYDVERES